MIMGKTHLRRVIAVLSLGAATVMAGCGADPSDTVAAGAGGGSVTAEPTNKITGSVREWSVLVSENHAYAGDVTFAITNFGTIQHEFLVVKTTYKPGKIPLGEANKFDEEDPGITVVDEIPEWAAGERKNLGE
jgi:hypothetical protein